MSRKKISFETVINALGLALNDDISYAYDDDSPIYSSDDPNFKADALITLFHSVYRKSDSAEDNIESLNDLADVLISELHEFKSNLESWDESNDDDYEEDPD